MNRMPISLTTKTQYVSNPGRAENVLQYAVLQHISVQEGMKTRNQALTLALDALMDWLRESVVRLQSAFVCTLAFSSTFIT